MNCTRKRSCEKITLTRGAFDAITAIVGPKYIFMIYWVIDVTISDIHLLHIQRPCNISSDQILLTECNKKNSRINVSQRKKEKLRANYHRSSSSRLLLFWRFFQKNITAVVTVYRTLT